MTRKSTGCRIRRMISFPVWSVILLWYLGSCCGFRSTTTRIRPTALPMRCQNTDSNGNAVNRRYFWLASGATLHMTVIMPNHDAARAVGEGSERMVFRTKPSAPTAALVPALQQRLLLEAALQLCSNKNNSSSDTSVNEVRLKSLLPPLSERTSYKRDDAVFKQYAPAKVLYGATTRAAMNIYTANLRYEDGITTRGGTKDTPNSAYDVTDPDWKKAYIRANDGLPDVKKVIVADLDLRDLYRNQVEQKLDDAAAELYAPQCDSQELRTLLKEAAVSFDQWLDRIAESDVQNAMRDVLAGKELQLDAAYTAGFLPPM